MDELKSTDEGFTITNNPYGEILWCDVAEIAVYKRDLFSVDLICIEFQLQETGRFVEIHEEMSGFTELMTVVEERYGLKESWWSDVALPAFQTNMTTLWSSARQSVPREP